MVCLTRHADACRPPPDGSRRQFFDSCISRRTLDCSGPVARGTRPPDSGPTTPFWQPMGGDQSRLIAVNQGCHRRFSLPSELRIKPACRPAVSESSVVNSRFDGGVGALWPCAFEMIPFQSSQIAVNQGCAFRYFASIGISSLCFRSLNSCRAKRCHKFGEYTTGKRPRHILRESLMACCGRGSGHGPDAD
jgi:hypothetical protein